MSDTTGDRTQEIVREIVRELWNRITYQAGQMIPGADGHLAGLAGDALADPFQYMPEAREWLQLAQYGAGEIDADPGEIREIAKGLAEWLFSIPGDHAYEIPDRWLNTPMGSLWAAALMRAQGDSLITLTEAAEILEVEISTVSHHVSRGNLRGYSDPTEPNPQRRRRVSRIAVEQMGAARKDRSYNKEEDR